jgi:hypothetical protein
MIKSVLLSVAIKLTLIFKYCFLPSFLLVYINCTKGFHYGISIYAYNVL